MQVPSLDWEDSPGEGNGNPLQYSCLEHPTNKQPGGLQSTGLQRVRYDWATNTFLFFPKIFYCEIVNISLQTLFFCKEPVIPLKARRPSDFCVQNFFRFCPHHKWKLEAWKSDCNGDQTTCNGEEEIHMNSSVLPSTCIWICEPGANDHSSAHFKHSLSTSHAQCIFLNCSMVYRIQFMHWISHSSVAGKNVRPSWLTQFSKKVGVYAYTWGRERQRQRETEGGVGAGWVEAWGLLN